MDLGLQVKYLWNDIHAYELGVSASNGQFSAVARPYVGIDCIVEAVAKIEGFPRNKSDVRELLFGAFGREFAGGAVHMRFSCVDAAGHAIVELHFEAAKLFSSDLSGSGPTESAQFIAEIEASAVDDFVAELRQLEKNRSGCANLRFL
jgi:hypothetical protein